MKFSKKTRLTTIAAILVSGVSGALAHSARADGFDCQGLSTGLRVHITNALNAAVGTRTPESMTIVNPLLHPDRQEVVRFSHQNQTLHYLGRGNYLGQVDLRYLDSGRRGENIAGTKLGQLKSILVDIEFSYAHSDIELANSVKEVPAKIFYSKRTGEILEEPAACKRFLMRR